MGTSSSSPRRRSLSTTEASSSSSTHLPSSSSKPSFTPPLPPLHLPSSYSTPSFTPPLPPFTTSFTPPLPPFTTSFTPPHLLSSSFTPSFTPPLHFPSSSSSSAPRRRSFSTMEASSSSSSPPSPSPPHSPSLRRDRNAPLRDPYRDPSSPPPPQETYYKRVADKRRKVETRRDKSLLHGFDLKPSATSLLHSNGVESLQTFIQEFTQIPIKKKLSKKKIFDSLASHYPTSFSLKLANLLSLHPPLHIRNEVVSLLRETLTETHGNDNHRIGCAMLVELRTPILLSFKNEVEEPLLPPLSETIANVSSRIYSFPLGGWLELLEYIVSCVSLYSDDDDSVLNQRKGLMLLADISSDIIQNYEFWKNRYGDLYENLMVRMLDETANEDFQKLTFNALVTMMGMAQPLGEFEIGGSILLILLGCIDRHPREEVVLRRVQDLGDFVSLDVGEVMIGKEENVFQTLIRIAEKEDATEKLRCAAVQVLKELDEINMDTMEQVIKELSDVDALRVLKVSLVMMLCIEDDPLWFESYKDSWTGVSQSFTLGRFLLNWLCYEGDGSMVVPMAIELLKTSYAASKNWRKRHAGMIVISAFAEAQKSYIVECFVEVEKLVINSLNDGHHRVVWAAMNAMIWLSEFKLIPHGKYEYHMKFFSKLFSVVKSSCYSKVQVEAIIAIHTLAKNCCLDKWASFGEEIVKVMLVLIKNDKQKIQEAAVETLKSVAALIPTNFQKYCDRTIESLKAILFHDYSKPRFLLCAKSLECLSSILLRIEYAKFTQEDSVKVMDSLILLERKLSSTDYLVRTHILKALDQFCRLPGVDVDRHLNNLMPMLLWSSKLDIDQKVYMPTNDSHLVENGRVQALNILSHCAVRSRRVFYPQVGRVSKIFADCLTCSSSETREASASAIPSLLLCAYSGERNELIEESLPILLVQPLVEALHRETNDNVHIKMLKILPECIPICGSFFPTELIKKIADEINHILRTWSQKFIESYRAQAGSLGERKDLPDEEMIQGAKLLIIAMAEALKGLLSPFLDDILSNVARLWGNVFPDRAKEIAVAIFNVIVPLFPDKLQRYHDIYTYQLLKVRDGSHQALRETARAIGICAEFGGDNFKTIVNVAITNLYSLIEHGRSIKGEEFGDGAMISDMAVSALGKICELHRENIDDPEDKNMGADLRWKNHSWDQNQKEVYAGFLTDASIILSRLDRHSKEGFQEQDIGSVKCSVIQSWLNYLPLSNDTEEARNAHARFSKLLQRKDVQILGPNMENLPKIITILRAILFRSDELATEETFTEIVEFMDKHDGGF